MSQTDINIGSGKVSTMAPWVALADAITLQPNPNKRRKWKSVMAGGNRVQYAEFAEVRPVHGSLKLKMLLRNNRGYELSVLNPTRMSALIALTTNLSISPPRHLMARSFATSLSTFISHFTFYCTSAKLIHYGVSRL